MNTFINLYSLNLVFLSFLMSWYDIFDLLYYVVTTFVNIFFFCSSEILKLFKQNLKVRVYNGSTLVKWEKQIEIQKQISYPTIDSHDVIPSCMASQNY